MIRRQPPDLHFEISSWQSGLGRLAGLDEAGRGAWAGPVSAAAVILPAEAELTTTLAGVRDSKQMTPPERTRWAVVIQKTALAWGVGMASHAEVDQLGIVPATRLAMRRALEQLSIPPEALLIDALHLPEFNLPQNVILHGDALCLSIAAASVLAKTARDALMTVMETTYPQYGFARHKGYGTSFHRAALERLGPCKIHRQTFAPIRKYLASGESRALP